MVVGNAGGTGSDGRLRGRDNDAVVAVSAAHGGHGVAAQLHLTRQKVLLIDTAVCVAGADNVAGKGPGAIIQPARQRCHAVVIKHVYRRINRQAE